MPVTWWFTFSLRQRWLGGERPGAGCEAGSL